MNDINNNNQNHSSHLHDGGSEEPIFWDAIAVTAPKYEHAEEFLKELKNRQNEGMISKKTFLISIPDPHINLEYPNILSSELSSLHIVEDKLPEYTIDEIVDEEERRKHRPTQSKVGSGSSMINSLFVITEKLSALSGKSYLDVDILKNKRILLLLNGGVHQHAPLVNLCTKSFSMVPLKDIPITNFNHHHHHHHHQQQQQQPTSSNNDENQKLIEKKHIENSRKYVGDVPVYPIDILLSNLNRIVGNLKPGFMLSSTESLIFFDKDDPNLKDPSVWKKPGVSVITMDIGPDYYTNHGVCKLNEETGEIMEIAYKQPKEYLEKNGFISKQQDTASIYTGVLFFCEKTTEKLLYLHNTPPLDSCTYLGVDSGSQLLKFGVFPDILCSMTKGETLESYLNQPCFYGTYKSLLQKARRVVWDTFRNTPIHSIKIKGDYYYLKNPLDYLNFIHSNKIYQISKKMHSFIGCQDLPVKGIVTNSILMGKCKTSETSIIYSSVLTGDWSIGERSIVFGVKCLSDQFHIKDNIIVNEIRLKSVKIKHSTNENPKTLIVLGIEDDLNAYYNDPAATIANRKWDEFLLTSGVSPDELWSKGVPRILRTARLFPIVINDDDDRMIEASLWIQNKESPPLSVIGRWKSSKRVSICDIIGESYLLDFTQLEVKQKSPPIIDEFGHVIGSQIIPNLKPSISSFEPSNPNTNTIVDANTDDLTSSASTASISSILSSKWAIEGDIQADFQWRREISFQVDSMEIEHILVQGIDQSILPFIEKWADSGVSLNKALEALDRISLSCPLQYTGRLLSCISDTLAVYVNNKGGLRSGPARNFQFQKPYSYFKRHEERKGFLSLIKERSKWLTSCESMIRVARHYEGAGQIVIKNIVDTCATELKPLDESVGDLIPPHKNDWICVSLPVRIDLAGGWTDTPPICYEHGGIVINAAITIRGKKPIQARVRRIDEPKLIFRVGGSGSDSIICHTLNDLMDYNQPHAPGALLKSCFLQLGLIDYSFINENIIKSPSTTTTKILKTLKEQLTELGGGIEVTSSSDLPTGSGLGTSSILAAGLVTGMAHAFGYKYSDQHLFHAVLKVEQMLTTGGGWQDQIGGVLGGFKEGKCSQFHSKSDKINVTVEKLPIDDKTVELINDHLLLVYTGRTRLARDLLQDVIRRWYAKTPEILSNTDSLISTTSAMKKALLSSDIKEIGACLIQYWNQKKAMAVGAEPTRITEIFNIVKEHTHGYSLAGAGGGGFMILITKDHCDIAKSKIQQIISKVDGLETVEIFDAKINTHGMDISIEKHKDYLQVPHILPVSN